MLLVGITNKYGKGATSYRIRDGLESTRNGGQSSPHLRAETGDSPGVTRHDKVGDGFFLMVFFVKSLKLREKPITVFQGSQNLGK